MHNTAKNPQAVIGTGLLFSWLFRTSLRDATTTAPPPRRRRQLTAPPYGSVLRSTQERERERERVEVVVKYKKVWPVEIVQWLVL